MKVTLFSQVSSYVGSPQWRLGSLLRRKGELISRIAPQAEGLHFFASAERKKWSERIKVVRKMMSLCVVIMAG